VQAMRDGAGCNCPACAHISIAIAS
jgi:hypothetical protein